MKKAILLVATAILFAGCNVAVANSFERAEVTDHYKNVIVQKPYEVQVCTEGNGKDDLTNFLEGAIVGGAIGNNIPGEKVVVHLVLSLVVYSIPKKTKDRSVEWKQGTKKSIKKLILTAV